MTRLILLFILVFGWSPLQAQDNPFDPGWALQADASTIRFQSVKQQTKVESSTFASMRGAVDMNGLATIAVPLDSVDTGIDLRNVRMRFLFFETFQFPEATISVQMTPDLLSDLPTVRRKVVTLPMTMDLHGISKTMDVELALTWISDDIVSVTSSAPLVIDIADFTLLGGLKKLEEAANVTILPSTTVTFDLMFTRAEAGGQQESVAMASTAPAAPATTALEAEGDFSAEACIGRFEILSRTDNIYFGFASAELDPASRAILDTIVDIISRCPGMTIEVSGHTDSDGATESNQALSEARAGAVKEYFTAMAGIAPDRIETRGYGESRPAFPNDSAENKRRNRRIEFAVLQ